MGVKNVSPRAERIVSRMAMLAMRQPPPHVDLS
jgi:hypothetical protein